VLTLPIEPADCPDGKPNLCGWPFRAALDALALIGTDIPISTAVDNTDRFPFLSPEGALTPVKRKDKTYPTQIIDGGYFDNSGALTALELAEVLQRKGPGWLQRGNGKRRKVRPVIVQATTAFAATDDIDNVTCAVPDPSTLPSTSKGRQSLLQFFAPVGGVDAVRGGHQSAIWREMRDKLCSGKQQRFFHFYLLDTPGHTVPLNWTLSKDMVGYIWDTALCEPGNWKEYGAMSRFLSGIDPGACPQISKR
jgi:hypothetical protein